jgi:serine phosphatase RsbU (regulator of sigma subunit)
MSTPPAGSSDRPPPTAALIGLALASTRLHPDDLAAVSAREASLVGIFDLRIYLADLGQRFLVPFGAGDATEHLSIDGTVAGRAYRTERPLVATTEGADAASSGTLVWLPLLDSAERLGVVSVRVETAIDEKLLSELMAVVSLTAETIANKAVYGDMIARTRRTEELTVAAEMRWSMLPPLTFTGRNLTISGVVEPAYAIAGDTFDYAVNGDCAHIAIIDAVGHGLEAARIANLAVVAYRHSRRRDLDQIDTYEVMDAVVAQEFGHEQFATAQTAVLTLSTGQLRWLNAGHPPPMVVRQGHRLDLVSEVSLPIGLSGAADPPIQPKLADVFLEPDDFVLFFTDGVVEARSIDGEEFGRDRLGDLIERTIAAGQTPAETMRVLGHAVLDHQMGVLQDDATLLGLAWHGPAPAIA